MTRRGRHLFRRLRGGEDCYSSSTLAGVLRARSVRARVGRPVRQELAKVRSRVRTRARLAVERFRVAQPFRPTRGRTGRGIPFPVSARKFISLYPSYRAGGLPPRNRRQSKALFGIPLLLGVPATVFMVWFTSSAFSPLYWATFPIWVLVGVLMMPRQLGIEGVRPDIPAVIRWKQFLFLAGVVVAATIAKGAARSPLVPAGASVGGYALGIMVGYTRLFLVRTKVLFCPKCDSVSLFLTHDHVLYCNYCGTRGFDTQRP